MAKFISSGALAGTKGDDSGAPVTILTCPLDDKLTESYLGKYD